MFRMFITLTLFAVLRPETVEARTCGTVATTHVQAQSLARLGCRWDGSVSPIDDAELAARIAYVDATNPPPSGAGWDTVKRPAWVLAYLTDVISTPNQDADAINSVSCVVQAVACPTGTLTSFWYPSTPVVRIYTGREFFCNVTGSDCPGTWPPTP